MEESAVLLHQRAKNVLVSPVFSVGGGVENIEWAPFRKKGREISPSPLVIDS